jgi:hypothetical protein
MDSDEISKWMAYDRINIDDSWRQNAELVWWLIQLLGDAKLKRRVKYEDLLPQRHKPPKPRQTAEQIKAVLMGFVTKK